MAALDKSSVEKPVSDLASPLSPYTIEAVHALSYIRIIGGASLIFAPTFTSRLFRLTIAPNSLESLLVRLFGIGGAVLGDLTWFNRPKFNSLQTESERKELRHVMWAGVASDALEGALVLYAVSKGVLPKPAALCFGGVTASFLAMGLFTARKL